MSEENLTGNERAQAAGSQSETFRLTFEPDRREGARIKVIGVGGGGGNAVNRMVRTGLEGVEFIVANTDLQALTYNAAPTRIQIGEQADERPRRRRRSGHRPARRARRHRQAHRSAIGRRHGLRDDGSRRRHGHRRRAGDRGASVGARRPDHRGRHQAVPVRRKRRRQLQAERGLAELRDAVDTVITIPNERLLATIDRRTPLPEAFGAADDVLRQAIQGISDLIIVPGMINLDFADVKTIMSGMGFAIMGTGTGEGETRAIDAANRAVSSPLLEDASVKGARGVIINITGGPDFALAEVNEAASIIQEAAHEDANIIFGAVIDPTMNGQGQDHRDRHRLRPARRPACRPSQPDARRPPPLHRLAPGRHARRRVAGGGRIAIWRRPVVDVPSGAPSGRAGAGR